MIKKSLIAAASSVALLSTGIALGASVFSDVPEDHWAADFIAEANRLGLMTGPGDAPGTFDPAGAVNRAQLATVIVRLHDMQNDKNVDLEERLALLEQRLGSSSSRSSSSSSRSSSSSVSSSVSSSSTSSGTGATRSFNASLTGSQEVPPISTAASGQGTFTLTGNNLQYTILAQSLSGAITAAHFHVGAPGVSGAVVQPIVFSGGRAEGTWTNLSDQYRQDLLNGNIYVNVHTAARPDGEIRGQVEAR